MNKKRAYGVNICLFKQNGKFTQIEPMLNLMTLKSSNLFKNIKLFWIYALTKLFVYEALGNITDKNRDLNEIVTKWD